MVAMRVAITVLLLPVLVLAYPYPQRYSEASSRPSRGKQRFKIEEIPVSASDTETFSASRKGDVRRRSGHEFLHEPDTASSVVAPVTQQLISSRSSSLRRSAISSPQPTEEHSRFRTNFNRRGSNSQDNSVHGIPSRRRELATEATQSPNKPPPVEEATQESNENYPTPSAELVRNIPSFETSISTTPFIIPSQTPSPSSFSRRRTSSSRNSDTKSSFSASNTFPERPTRFESSRRRQHSETLQDAPVTEGRRTGRRNSARGSVNSNSADFNTNLATNAQDIPSRSRNSGRRDSVSARSGRGEKTIVSPTLPSLTARSRTLASQQKSVKENENINNIIPVQELPEEPSITASKRMDTIGDASEDPILPDHTEIISSDLELSSTSAEEIIPSSSELPSTAADSLENTPKPLENLHNNRRKSATRTQSNSRDPVINERTFKTRSQSGTQNIAVGTGSRRGVTRTVRLNDNTADYSTNSNTGFEESFNVNAVNYRRDYKVSSSSTEPSSQRSFVNSRRNLPSSRGPSEETEAGVTGPSFRSSSRRNWDTLKSSNDISAEASTLPVPTQRITSGRRSSTFDTNRRLTTNERRNSRGSNADKSEPHVEETFSRRGSRSRSNVTPRTESNSVESTRPVSRSGRRISEPDVTSAPQRSSRRTSTDVGQRGSFKDNSSTRNTPKYKKISRADEEIDESENYPAGFLKALKALKSNKNGNTADGSEENRKTLSSLKRTNIKASEKENVAPSTFKDRTRKVSLLLAPSPPSESNQDTKSQSNDVQLPQDEEKTKNPSQNKLKTLDTTSDTISSRAKIPSKTDTFSVGDISHKPRPALKPFRTYQSDTTVSKAPDASHQIASPTFAPAHRTTSRIGSNSHRDFKSDLTKTTDSSQLFESDEQHQVKKLHSGKGTSESISSNSNLSTPTIRTGYVPRSRSNKVSTVPTSETSSRNSYSSRTRSTASSQLRTNPSSKQGASAVTTANIPDSTPQPVLVQSQIAPSNPHRFSARYRNDLLRVTGALRSTTSPAYVATVPTVSTTTPTTTTALPYAPDVENSSEALTLDASSLTIEKSNLRLTDIDSDVSIPSLEESNEIFPSSTEIELQTSSNILENPNPSVLTGIAETFSLASSTPVTTTNQKNIIMTPSDVISGSTTIQTSRIISTTNNPKDITLPNLVPTVSSTIQTSPVTKKFKTITVTPPIIKTPKTITTTSSNSLTYENIEREVRNVTTPKPMTTETTNTILPTTTFKPTTTSTTGIPTTTSIPISKTTSRILTSTATTITTNKSVLKTTVPVFKSTNTPAGLVTKTLHFNHATSATTELSNQRASESSTAFSVKPISVEQNSTYNSVLGLHLSTETSTIGNIDVGNSVKLTAVPGISQVQSTSSSPAISTTPPTTTIQPGRFVTRLTVAPRGADFRTSTLSPPPQFVQSMKFEILNSDEASIYNPPPPVQYIYTQPPTRRTPAPYVIFGIFPNNTIFRKFPDSDIKEIVSENEISRPQSYYPHEYHSSSESNNLYSSTQGYTNMDNFHRTNQDAQNTALYNLHHSAENEVLRTNAATFSGGGSEPDVPAQPTASVIPTITSNTESTPIVSAQQVNHASPAIVPAPVEFSNSVYNGQDSKYKNFWSSTSTKKPQFHILTTDIPFTTPTPLSSTPVLIVTPEPQTTVSSTTEVFRWKPVTSTLTPESIGKSTENVQKGPTLPTTTAGTTTTQTSGLGLRGLISQVLGNLPVSSTMRSTSEAAVNSSIVAPTLSPNKPTTSTTTTEKPVTTTTTVKPTITTTTTKKPTTTTTTTKKPTTTTTTTKKPTTTTTTTKKPTTTTTTTKKPTTTTTTTKKPITTTTTTKKPITTTTTTKKPTTTTTTTKKPTTTTTTTKKPTTTSTTTTTTKKPTTTTTTTKKPTTTTTTTKKPTTTTTTTKKPTTTTTTTRKPTTTTTKKPVTTTTTTAKPPTTSTITTTTITSSNVTPASSPSTSTSKGLAANSFGDLSFLNSLFGGQQENKKRPGRERAGELANKVVEVAIQRASTSSTTSQPTLKTKDSELNLQVSMLQDQFQEKPRPSREKDIALANKVIEVAMQRPSTSTSVPSLLDNKSTSLSPDEQFLAELLNSQSKKSIGSSSQIKTTVAPKLSPDEQFLAALLQSQLKVAVTTKPKPQTSAPKKLSPDEQFLAALLQGQLGGSSTSKPKSQGNGLKLTDEQLLAALLNGAKAGGSQAKNQNIRTTTTVATTAARPSLFGGLLGQLGGGNILPESEVEIDDGEPPRGQRLVKAAIDVTKAVSQFMNVVIQGASERFQTFFKSGTNLLSNYFSWSSSQSGSI